MPLDLDDCRDKHIGKLSARAQKLVDDAGGAYVEVTPSGTVIRVIGKAHGDEVHTIVPMQGGKVEAYRDCDLAFSRRIGFGGSNKRATKR